MFVRGHKYVLGPTQTHFSPSRKARVQMSSEKGPKYIYAQEQNFISIVVTLRK